MKKEVIVSNDCCDYKLDGTSLLYNDGQSTGYDEWGEVQIFEHFSKGDIQYLNKKFGIDVWVGCGQFGNCTEELIDTDDLVEFAKERLA
jgi:hypothetical protein|tara:strand:- start:307 stop:573 length:267 start_codon:yes stop_codon:yes gene_type:complete